MSDPTRLLDLIAAEFATLDEPFRARGAVIAVSGGVDSSALAWLMSEARRTGRITGPLTIGHVDHGVREDSGGDARATERLAGQLGIPFVQRHLNLSIDAGEAIMRDGRYRALEDIAAERAAGVLLTAHHADDVLETMVFRLGRGTGLRGLSGIPRVRRSRTGLTILRPLLRMRRASLVSLCRDAGIDPCEDISNLDLLRARNRIRHRSLPALRRDPRARDAEQLLLTAADLARATTERLERTARAWLTARGRRESTPIAWSLRVDPSDDRATVREALRLIHLDLGCGAPTRDWLDRAASLVDGRPGRRLAGRGRTVQAARTRDGLSLTSS